MLYLGLLPVLVISLLVVLPSSSKPLSNKSAYWQRKKYPDGHLFCIRRDIRRPLTPPVSLLLPPESTIVILRLAIWYVPLLLGNLSITALVYLFQAVHCAILLPLRTKSLHLCYNTIVTAGGFEPPRQLASGCQDRHVCQFHHAVRSENLVEGDSLPAQPSTKSHLKNIPKHGHLSIGKPTLNVLNNGNKSNIGGVVMAVCPYCYSREMIKHGKYKRRQRWLCLKCKHTTLNPRQRVPKGYGS